jgi:Fe-S cluster assembly ATPase SufC
MTTLILTIDDHRAEALRSAASIAGVSVEDFLRREVDALIDRRKEVNRAVAETLREDAELYRRLAQ